MRFQVEEGAGHFEGAWAWRLTGSLEFLLGPWWKLDYTPAARGPEETARARRGQAAVPLPEAKARAAPTAEALEKAAQAAAHALPGGAPVPGAAQAAARPTPKQAGAIARRRAAAAAAAAAPAVARESAGPP